jgi:hypothetical protein
VLLDPKEIDIDIGNGQTKTFIVSRLPYLSGGREVLTQFMPTAVPKVGDYPANEALAAKMFSCIAVPREGADPLCLTTADLVNSHVPNFRAGLQLEKAMLEHNLGFSVAEGLSTFLEGLNARLPALITQTLTEYRAQLSAQAKPPLES